MFATCTLEEENIIQKLYNITYIVFTIQSKITSYVKQENAVNKSRYTDDTDVGISTKGI